MWLYAALSVLLLFTAAIVFNIESIQQTLNIALNEAYGHVFVPVEVLIWARSLAVILLIIAHSVKHIDLSKDTRPNPLDAEHIARMVSVKPGPIEHALQVQLHTQVQDSNTNGIPKRDAMQLPFPQNEEITVKLLPKPSLADLKKQEAAINKEKVSEYMTTHPDAKACEIAKVLTFSLPTVGKHIKDTKGK